MSVGVLFLIQDIKWDLTSGSINTGSIRLKLSIVLKTKSLIEMSILG